jgi:type IV pilus assembly protein PilE
MTRRAVPPMGFTLVEALTLVVALVVIAAVAIPLWRASELRSRRADAMQTLETVQAAQDRYFGQYARYADGSAPSGGATSSVVVPSRSARGFYDIELRRDADGLGYTVIARARAMQGQRDDSRCVEMRLDHQGRRTARNAEGADTSADCWNKR